MKAGLRRTLLGSILLASIAAPAAWINPEITPVDSGAELKGTNLLHRGEGSHLFTDSHWDLGAWDLGALHSDHLAEKLWELAFPQCDSERVGCDSIDFDFLIFPEAVHG